MEIVVVLLTFCCSYLYISFLEWLLHKYVMHERVNGVESVYEDHMIHHITYHAGTFGGKDNEAPEKRFTNLVVCSEQSLMLIAVPAAICFILSPIIGLAFLLTVLIHTVLFNTVHPALHLRHKTWLPVWYHDLCLYNHVMHHIYPRSHYCVAFPGFDYLVGTWRKATSRDWDEIEEFVNKGFVDSLQQQADRAEMAKQNYCPVPAFNKAWKKLCTKGTVPEALPENLYNNYEGPINWLALPGSLWVGDYEVYGAENLTKETIPYVLAFNHTSWKDLIIIPCVMHLANKYRKTPSGFPRLLVHPNVLSFLGPVTATLFTKYLGFVPVSISAGKELLKQKEIVAICPEGWSYNTGGPPRHFHTGVLRIAENYSVIPVSLRYGKYPKSWILSLPVELQFFVSAAMPWLKSGVVINIGEPIRPQLLESEADYKAAATSLQKKVEDLYNEYTC